MRNEVWQINVNEASEFSVVRIEAPGCVVELRHKLHDENGNRVTRIDVKPDEDRYPDQRPWWVDGVPGLDQGVAVRIVEEGSDAD
jgi:hypothetical protein